jgi:hypothetical protein
MERDAIEVVEEIYRGCINGSTPTVLTAPGEEGSGPMPYFTWGFLFPDDNFRHVVDNFSATIVDIPEIA